MDIIERNNYIIDIVKKQIELNNKKSVDLVAITGSMVTGNYYEKSDLDLFIIVNDRYQSDISKCFIIDGVGIDIHTHDWKSVEEIANYNNPYVSKIKDFKIIYYKNEAILKKINKLSKILDENIIDNNKNYKKIKTFYTDIITNQMLLNTTHEIKKAYRYVFNIMINTENILYMMNNTYIKNGIKNIPEEIKNMRIVPEKLLDNYIELPYCNDIEQMIIKTQNIVDSFIPIIKEIDKYKEEEKITKKEITPFILKGTYEAIVSNWYNKVKYACDTNNTYLSFSVMNRTQSFYDEMYNKYNIEQIELIEKYDPNDLNHNYLEFKKALKKWKKLYDEYDIDVEEYNELKELDHLYDEKIEIRKAGIEDLLSINILFINYIKKLNKYKKDNDIEVKPEEMILENGYPYRYLNEYIKENNILLAIIKNKIIGFIAYRENDEIRIDDLCIKDEYQNKKIGRTLIHKIIKKNKKITVYIDNINQIKISFYKKVGFVKKDKYLNKTIMMYDK